MFQSLALTALALSLTAPLAAQGYHGFNPANIDKSVSPCADFFDYAVGGWVKRTPIPGQYSRYGVDEEIEQRMNPILKGILEGAAKAKAEPGSELRKVGDFFATGMDTAAIEKAGLSPLKEVFSLISSLEDTRRLPRVLSSLHMQGLDAGPAFYIEQDDKESTRYAAFLVQDGLGLPDRDYYLENDAKAQGIRAKYQQHVARILELAGATPDAAHREAGHILALETQLAKASMSRTEQRDPNATYHKMSVDELMKLAPGFDWRIYFVGLAVYEKDIIVRQPAFMKAFAALTKSVPADQWQSYLRWQVLRSSAPFLPERFDTAHFEFYGRTLRGSQTQKERWERVLASTDRALGEAVGKLYVQKAFPPEAKAKMLEITKNVMEALRTRILKLEWMSEPTKQRALEKLGTIVVKIGYPDVWRDYSKLAVHTDSYLGNVLRARDFEFQRRRVRLGKPLDRNEWGMTPATNNAYYNPSMNEICFPAGILQPPYFDLKADDAVNYGNIGATIGHELTHGFDDEGRNFDAQGNLKDWWTPEDTKAFDARAQLVVKQFDAFMPLPGQAINGKMTLGENIADLGGLMVAWDAWKLSQKGKPPLGLIEGFTPEQRFFLGYAETWRTQFRPEELANRLKTDVHAPAKWRVLAPLSNLPDFHQAFGCKEGEAMFRALKDRPSIW